MWDWDDFRELELAFWATNPVGWVLIIFLICLVVAGVVAYRNEHECEARRCPQGGTARMTEHGCYCLEAPE